MKIVLFGHQNWGVKAVNVFSELGMDIAKVFTHPLDMDEHEKVWYESVKEICDKKGIPVEERTKLTNDDVKEITSIKPDIIFSAGWRRLLPKSIFQIPKLGTLNLHDSLIPKYRGFAPINWAIINGEKEVGLTIHYIDEGIDTGDIILQEKIDVEISDTAYDAYLKLLEISESMLKKVINMIQSGEIKIISQDSNSGFFCSRRFPADGRIDWKKDRIQVYNLIRALSEPYPNAFFFFEDKQIFVKEAKLVSNDFRGPPGRICSIDDEGIIVTCGIDHTKNQALLITRIATEEKTYSPHEYFNKLWAELS